MQSDDRLANLFRRGVEPAFDELVRRHRPSLVAFAGGIAGPGRAEDVVQDSLVKAHRAMADEQVREPKAWLYRVVRNTALNEIRDGRKHEHADLGESEASPRTPESEVERREEFGSLVAALSELPEAQRRALVGRELCGYTHEQIAREMKITTGATKQLIFRARTGLRDALGALIPVPLIVWLASDASGAFTAASTTGAAAAGGAAAGAAGGAAGGSAGIFAGLAGGSAAKMAAVAVAATGTVAAGVAVEQEVVADRNAPAVVREADVAATAPVSTGTAGGSSGGSAPGVTASEKETGADAKAGEARGTGDQEGASTGELGEVGPAGEESTAGDPADGFGRRPGKGPRPGRPAGAGKWGEGSSRPNKPWKPAGGGGGGNGGGSSKPWKPSGSGGADRGSGRDLSASSGSPS